MPIVKPAEEISDNLLLSALPENELKDVSASLEILHFGNGDVLWESNETCRHLYFPVGSLVSLSYESEDGASTSIAVVGRTGIVGSGMLMPNVRTPDRAVVMIAGGAFRMRIDSVKAELAECGDFQELLLAYTHTLIARISQNAVCSRLHRIEQQVCRVILEIDSELGAEWIPLTHDQIAHILGVRRESVSVAISSLQKRKMIRAGRGRIQIADAHSLAKSSCECFEVVKEQVDATLRKYRSEHN